jgi:hypothetical protein
MVDITQMDAEDVNVNLAGGHIGWFRLLATAPVHAILSSFQSPYFSMG